MNSARPSVTRRKSKDKASRVSAYTQAMTLPRFNGSSTHRSLLSSLTAMSSVPGGIHHRVFVHGLSEEQGQAEVRRDCFRVRISSLVRPLAPRNLTSLLCTFSIMNHTVSDCLILMRSKLTCNAHRAISSFHVASRVAFKRTHLDVEKCFCTVRPEPFQLGSPS